MLLCRGDSVCCVCPFIYSGISFSAMCHYTKKQFPIHMQLGIQIFCNSIKCNHTLTTLTHIHTQQTHNLNPKPPFRLGLRMRHPWSCKPKHPLQSKQSSSENDLCLVNQSASHLNCPFVLNCLLDWTSDAVILPHYCTTLPLFFPSPIYLHITLQCESSYCVWKLKPAEIAAER